jgi:hypothetical protein
MRDFMLHYGGLLRVFMYTGFTISRNVGDITAGVPLPLVPSVWLEIKTIYHYLQLLFTVPKFCAGTHHFKLKSFCKMPITDSQITHNSCHMMK